MPTVLHQISSFKGVLTTTYQPEQNNLQIPKMNFQRRWCWTASVMFRRFQPRKLGAGLAVLIDAIGASLRALSWCFIFEKLGTNPISLIECLKAQLFI